jgi:peptide/nickel transport system substrate-binding protein
MGANRQLVPFLCESVKVDDKKFTMTFKLRKGIKFHDGSELNADVAVWNFKMDLEAKKIRFGDLIKSIEINDPYTFTLHMSEYNNQMLFGYGFTAMFSKKAYETHGKEWCRMNPVGTGPFKFVEYKRDNYIKWERFPDYWQKGKPNLDGVEMRIVPDPVTSVQMFESKQVDMWISASARDQFDLVKKGFKRQTDFPALPYLIYMNTAKADAPTANLKVREAINTPSTGPPWQRPSASASTNPSRWSRLLPNGATTRTSKEGPTTLPWQRSCSQRQAIPMG